MTDETNRHFWLRAARDLQFRFNFAMWLDSFLKGLIAFSILAAVGIILCRRFGYSSSAVAWTFSIFAALTALISFYAVRRGFIGRDQALVRLDEAFGLDSRLSSAAGGVGQFPAPIAGGKAVPPPYLWRSDRLGLLTAIPAVLILAALLVPLPRVVVATVNPKQPPLAVSEVEKLLEKLEKDAVVEKRDLNQLKEQADSITKQNPEQWYDQHSLEAADSLKEKAENGVESLAHSMEQASKALGQLSEAMKEASPEMKQELKAQLDKTIKELQEGSLHPSEEMSKALSDLAKANPDSIPQELMDSIKGKLKSSAKILKEDLKKGGQGGESKSGQGGERNGNGDSDKSGEESECDGDGGEGGMCTNSKKKGSGQGEGQGKGSGNGQEGPGAPNRGPGTAPLNLKEHSPQFTSPRTEELKSKPGVQNPGDLVGMTSQAPQFDKGAASKQQTAGGAGVSSAGGEAVSNGVYTPDESEVLKKYFH